MKVQILQENLLKSLLRASRIISSKTHLPILQNVLLKTEDGLLRVIATNMETTVSSLVKAKEEKPGASSVPAKLLAELVATLPKEILTLEEKDGTLLVYGAKNHAEIATSPASEFPPLDTGGVKNKDGIEKEKIREALGGVLFAAATDDARPLLTGVKIVFVDNQMTLAATDGFRLSVKKLVYNTKSTHNALLPARSLSEALKILSEEKDEKLLMMDVSAGSQGVLSIGDTTIVCRTLDGDYPAYEKIIPKQHTTSAAIDAGALRAAVKSASLFARDTSNILKFHFGDGAATVSANTPQVGKNTVEVDAEIVGDDADIAFNSRFLTEFLANYNQESVVFEMTGSLNPGVFHPPKDDSYIHIIMPVRVQS